MTTPHVRIEPGHRFGEPHIRGIPVDAIVSSYWVGDDAAGEFTLTRDELLVACWFAARHGSKAKRRRWASWLKAVEYALWKGDWGVGLPPTREDGGQNDE